MEMDPTFWVALFGFLAALAGNIFSYINSRKLNSVRQQQETAHSQINGVLTALVKSERAEAVKETTAAIDAGKATRKTKDKDC